jgi:hypothetical protein
MRRTLLALGLLAFGGGLLASSVSPARAFGQTEGSPLATLTLNAAGEKKTTPATVEAGKDYILVLSGTATASQFGGMQQHDPLYCFGGCIGSPSYDELTLHMRYADAPPQGAVFQGIARWVPSSAFPPYSPSHVYQVRFTASFSGRLEFATNVTPPLSSPRPMSGSFTVALRSLSAGDRDGDGLLDHWETRGVDTNGDGKIDLDLARMGADPGHKDLFVELDYMKPHKLRQAAIDIVVRSFANAPVSNPDGRTGINLHVDNGPRSTMNPVTGTRWGRLSEASKVPHQEVLGRNVGGEIDPRFPTLGKLGAKYDWSEFDAIKSRYFSRRRRPLFRYALSIHQLPGNLGGPAGEARGIPSSDFIVSHGRRRGGVEIMLEGTIGQAGTFMHELGHTLGLFHGGDSPGNNKPNYLSIMNYLYSSAGLSRSTNPNPVLDYSRFSAATAGGTVAELNEAALDEDAGLPATGAAANYRFMRFCPGDFVVPSKEAGGLLNMNTGIDWNCNGFRDRPGPTDIDNSDEITTIKSFDDWTFLARPGGLRVPSTSGLRSAARLPATTEAIDPMPLKTLHRIAQVARGDSMGPRVRITVRRSPGGTGKARLKVAARDNRMLDSLLVVVDRKRKTVQPKKSRGRPRRTRVLTYSARLSGSGHLIRVLAVDQTGNLSGPVKQRVGSG